MKTILEIPVRGYHIDHFGHVNHGRYVEMLEEARWHYLEENALLGPIHEHNGIHVVARLDIQYLAPAGVGDHLRIESSIAGRFAKGFVMKQAISLRDSTRLVLKAKVTNVFIDAKGQACPVRPSLLHLWPDLADVQKKSGIEL